jgi:hypothetical protein
VKMVKGENKKKKKDGLRMKRNIGKLIKCRW